MISSFLPLNAWQDTARHFFSCGTCKLRAVSIACVDTVEQQIMQLVLKCSIETNGKLKVVSFVLKHPTVMLIFWFRGEDNRIHILMARETQIAIPRRQYTIPYGCYVNGVLIGELITQLRSHLGLTLSDAQKIEMTKLHISPHISNETFEYYEHEIHNLTDLLDADEDETFTVMPLEKAVLHADGRTTSILLNSMHIFACNET